MANNKKNTWNLAEMQESLVKDTEQRISDGFQEIKKEKEQQATYRQSATAVLPLGGEPATAPQKQEEQEPTKGVQTYIPMSMYRRLNDIKLTRRENIATLVAEAIGYWLDAQDAMK